jgi:hypothetical protein
MKFFGLRVAGIGLVSAGKIQSVILLWVGLGWYPMLKAQTLSVRPHKETEALEHAPSCAEAKVKGFQRARLGQEAGLDRVAAANRGADTYDIHYYRFDLNVTTASTALSGNVTFKATVLGSGMDTFWFELRSFMAIDSVVFNGQRWLGAQLIRVGEVVRLPLPTTLPTGAALECRVFYGGTPSGAGFFAGVTSAASSTWGVRATWTLSEPFGAPDWFPCKQDLWDKIDSVDFVGNCANPNKVASNGILVSTQSLPNNRTRFEWRTRYPQAFYLIAFAVAPYTEYLNYARPVAGDSVLIQHWIYNANNSSGQSCLNFWLSNLNQTPDMLERFSRQWIYYPFRAEKYGHMMAPLGGGMEHQTMSTMGSFSTDLVSHELAHQWFGDLVTCASWSDIWLNEGWASYGEYLYRQAALGQSSANSWMSSAQSSARSVTNASVYVPAGADENRIFNSALSYKKGACVLHMLRNQLGDSVFFRAARQYLLGRQHAVATTDEFRQYLESGSGVNLQPFFQDWIYGQGHPTYSLTWNQSGNNLWVQVSQSVTTPSVTASFRNKIPIRLVFTNTAIPPQTIWLNPVSSVASYLVGGTINTLSLDPDNILLKGTSTVVRNNSLTGCRVTDSTFSLQGCASVTGPLGRVFTASGTYVDTLRNFGGCDSLLIQQVSLGSSCVAMLGDSVCAGSVARLRIQTPARNAVVGWQIRLVGNPGAFGPPPGGWVDSFWGPLQWSGSASAWTLSWSGPSRATNGVNLLTLPLSSTGLGGFLRLDTTTGAHFVQTAGSPLPILQALLAQGGQSVVNRQCGQTPVLSGRVSYDRVPPLYLQGAVCKLRRLGTGQVVAVDTTDMNGTYGFDVPAGGGGDFVLEIIPLSPWGGVNASDALQVARYFGGGITWAPIRIRAGDVNVNLVTNGTDALLVNRRLTGLINSFAAGDWLVEPAQISWNGFISTQLDWVVLCSGDVNGSYQPSNSTSRGGGRGGETLRGTPERNP